MELDLSIFGFQSASCHRSQIDDLRALRRRRLSMRVLPVFPWIIPGKSGDGEIRTLDPLLARQVLSQLSYTPTVPISVGYKSGLKWTRTTDLTLIRRAL